MLTFSALDAQDIIEYNRAAVPIAAFIPTPPATSTAVQWFAARLDDEIIGMAALAGDTVQTVAVLPQYRRQGVGRMLVGQMAGAVAQSGGYLLHADLPTEAGAATFAEQLGFCPDAHTSGQLCLDLTNTDGLRQH